MWSNKYIGLSYVFGSHNLDQGTDCLRLVEEIYKKEKNFHIYEGDSPVTLDWYVKNPERLIRLAVEHGEVITSISDLKEFDAVFFKMKNIIRHIGVMINNHGKFIHQLQKQSSRVDDLNSKCWGKQWFCGIRPRFDEKKQI